MDKRLPVPDVQDSDFGAFLEAAAGPVQMLEEPARDLMKVDPSDMTDREIQIAQLLELRAIRQCLTLPLPTPILREWKA